MPEEDTTADGGLDAEQTDRVIAGLVAADAATPKPVFTPLPDEELNPEEGLIGHLDGVGVYSRTVLEREIDGSDGPFVTTTTVYVLEAGGVWNVDEWGDHEEYPDHERDDAHLVVAELEELGWATIDYDSVHSRLDQARPIGPGKSPVNLHRAGFRQWGFEVVYSFGVTELFWCDPGQKEQVAQEKAEGYRGAGHTARVMHREVGPAVFADLDQ